MPRNVSIEAVYEANRRLMARSRGHACPQCGLTPRIANSPLRLKPTFEMIRLAGETAMLCYLKR